MLKAKNEGEVSPYQLQYRSCLCANRTEKTSVTVLSATLVFDKPAPATSAFFHATYSTSTITSSGRLKTRGISVDSLASPRLTIMVVSYRS